MKYLNSEMEFSDSLIVFVFRPTNKKKAADWNCQIKQCRISLRSHLLLLLLALMFHDNFPEKGREKGLFPVKGIC